MSASLPIVSTHFDSPLDRGAIRKKSRIYNVRCVRQPHQSNDTAHGKYRWHSFRDSVRYFARADEVIEIYFYDEESDYSALNEKKAYTETSRHYSIPLCILRYLLIKVMIG